MTKNIEVMIAEVDKLDDQIFEINQTIADKVSALRNKKAEIKSLLDIEIAKSAAESLSDKDYGCGTATIKTDRYKIKVVVSKKIKWDEDVLRQVANQIRTSGQDPEVYIKYKLSVSETAFKNFPDNVQDVFVPAREVTPSAPKITIEKI